MTDQQLSDVAKEMSARAETGDWAKIAEADLRAVLMPGDSLYYIRTGIRATIYAIRRAEDHPYLMPVTAMIAHFMSLKMSDQGGMIWPDAQFALTGGLSAKLFSTNSLQPVSIGD